jgi:ribose transport system substrate-binding protein
MVHNEASARRLKRCRFLAVVTVALFLAAACSSSSPSSGSSSSPAAATGSSSGGAAVAAAQAAVTKAMVAPTKILQTVPLKSKPPAKTIVFLQCELSSCGAIGSGVQAGAKALGWTFKSIPFKTTDATTLISAMKQALQYHPYAVTFSGTPEAIWSSEIPAYRAAGAKIIPIVIGPLSSVSATVPVEIGDFTSSGTALGDWFIADSGGKGDALVFNIPAFPVLTQVADGIQNAIKSGCPGCQMSSLQGTLPEVGAGQIPSVIVTALKKNPNIKYLLTSNLLLVSGVVSALKTAGLSDVKVAGDQPESSDLQGIQGGTEYAATISGNPILGWMAVDSAARLAEGMIVPPGDSGTPLHLLTKQNLSSTNLNAYILPSDYAAQFEALWHLGS